MRKKDKLMKEFLKKWSEYEEDIRKKRCSTCKTPFIPALDCVIFGTKKWDGHSYRHNCKCVDKDLIMSEG